MPRLLTLLDVLRVTRVATAYGVVANAWFVVLWVRRHPAHESEPATAVSSVSLFVALFGSAAISIGLYSFATAINDLIDANRDRALRLDRPIATGSLSIEQTLGIVLATAGAALLGSATFGTVSVLMCLALLFGCFVYNASLRFIPGIGLPLLGGLYATQMIIPAPGLHFLWPVWLIFTHITLTAILTHVIGKRSPRLSPRGAFTAVLTWVIATAAGGIWAWSRSENPSFIWPDWTPTLAALGPGIVLAAFLIVAVLVISRRGRGTKSAERLWRYGALWMPLYNAAFFFGDGALGHAGLMLGLAAFGPIAIAAVRELYALAQHPIGFRLN